MKKDIRTDFSNGLSDLLNWLNAPNLIVAAKWDQHQTCAGTYMMVQGDATVHALRSQQLQYS